MSQQILISDETYNTLVALAADRGQSPEVLAAQLLQQQVDQEWEAICAKFDDLTATPEWQVMEREADEEYTAGHFTSYENDEAFLKALEEHR